MDWKLVHNAQHNDLHAATAQSACHRRQTTSDEREIHRAYVQRVCVCDMGVFGGVEDLITSTYTYAAFYTEPHICMHAFTRI